MSLMLLIEVHFHDGRYHGSNDWPPSPARLFQAMVAGTGNGGAISQTEKDTFHWFETLDPPVILAPKAEPGKEVVFFVPQNDYDEVYKSKELKVREDKLRKIRYRKRMRPWLFDARTPLYYAWKIDEKDSEHAEEVCRISRYLFRLGHGIDIAWANGRILKPEEFQDMLISYKGYIHYPTGQGGISYTLPCPSEGTCESLERRFNTHLFQPNNPKNIVRPPIGRFLHVAYNSPPIRYLFELHKSSRPTEFASYDLNQACTLVKKIREIAIDRLSHMLSNRQKDILEAFDDKVHPNSVFLENNRINIIPLPSIGHRHVDYKIRRILVEVPMACKLYHEDILWALSGRTIAGMPPDFSMETTLRRVEDLKNQKMLSNYRISGGEGSRIWRTVTAAALPTKRRRIDPSRAHDEVKTASERLKEEGRAIKAIFNELRTIPRIATLKYRGRVKFRTIYIMPQIESIRVQREPFQAKGIRAEAFHENTPFVKHQLWHAEIVFKEPINGPLAIGLGRYLGLGVMEPYVPGERR